MVTNRKKKTKIVRPTLPFDELVVICKIQLWNDGDGNHILNETYEEI